MPLAGVPCHDASSARRGWGGPRDGERPNAPSAARRHRDLLRATRCAAGIPGSTLCRGTRSLERLPIGTEQVELRPFGGGRHIGVPRARDQLVAPPRGRARMNARAACSVACARCRRCRRTQCLSPSGCVRFSARPIPKHQNAMWRDAWTLSAFPRQPARGCGGPAAEQGDQGKRRPPYGHPAQRRRPSVPTPG